MTGKEANSTDQNTERSLKIEHIIYIVAALGITAAFARPFIEAVHYWVAVGQNPGLIASDLAIIVLSPFHDGSPEGGLYVFTPIVIILIGCILLMMLSGEEQPTEKESNTDRAGNTSSTRDWTSTSSSSSTDSVPRTNLQHKLVHRDEYNYQLPCASCGTKYGVNITKGALNINWFFYR